MLSNRISDYDHVLMLFAYDSWKESIFSEECYNNNNVKGKTYFIWFIIVTKIKTVFEIICKLIICSIQA